MKQVYSISEVARILRVPPHKITYQYSVGKLPEPDKVLGRRAYHWNDIVALGKHLGVEVEEGGRDAE